MAKFMRAMKRVVKGWGGTRGCYCGLVLNNDLPLDLLECKNGEMQVPYKQ